MDINPKDITYEYPDKDNTHGEHLRYICDATHVPSGFRARGRGSSGAAARLAAVTELKLTLE